MAASGEVLSAAELLPELYQTEEDRACDDLQYDLFNLSAADLHALPTAKGQAREDLLMEAAARTTQLLVRRIFECAHERSEVGPLALLPAETSVLPREKRVPEPKPETKWEKYARDKGIQKRKKDRMVFDEGTQSFAPRYGYKRAKAGEEEHAVIEVKPGQDPHADPFEAASKDKRDRVKKNAKNQAANTSRALRKGGRSMSAVDRYDPSSVPGIPVDMTGEGKAKGKRGKAGLKNALQLAQLSTASMGRFDERREGEPAQRLAGKKRQFKDNISSVDADRKRMKAQIRIVADKVDKKARGVTNSLAAYEGIIPDAPTDSFKKKKGRSGNTALSKPKGSTRK